MEMSPQLEEFRASVFGIPLAGERPVNAAEKAALEEQSRQALWRTVAWGCATLIDFILIFCVVLWFSMYGRSASAPVPDNTSILILPEIMTMLVFVTLSGLFLLARDSYKLYKITKGDLRNGRIKYYQRSTPNLGFFRTENDFARMVNIGGIIVPLLQPIRLEVFGSSGKLQQVNGVQVKKRTYLREEHTARQPNFVWIDTNWRELTSVRSADKESPIKLFLQRNYLLPQPIPPLPGHDEDVSNFDLSKSEQRVLSPEERNEIRHRARTAWCEPLFWAIFFTAAIAAQIIAFLQSPWLIILLLLIDIPFAIKPYIELKRMIWWSRQLFRDARQGFVAITRIPGKKDESGTVMEWLPNSKSSWNIRGKPAFWRHQRRKKV